jgi:aspartate 1-decarboxylase
VVIVATFTQLDDAAARGHKPRIVLLGEGNRIVQSNAEEVPGPQRR